MDSLKFGISRVGKIIIQFYSDICKEYKDLESFIVCKITSQNSSACLYALMDRDFIDDSKAYLGFFSYTEYKVFACLDDLKTYIDSHYRTFDDGFCNIVFDGDFV